MKNLRLKFADCKNYRFCKEAGSVKKYNAMFNVSNALNALETLTLTNKHVKIDSEVRLCCQKEKL